MNKYSVFTEIGKNSNEYQREYRKRKREEQLKARRVEPRKAARTSTE